jgi:hypothetical protein
MEEVIGASVFMETLRIILTNKQLALGLEVVA